MTRRIYISGPITGYVDGNRAEFFRAEALLRGAGFEAVNPHANGLPESATWQEHMRADVRMLLDCDGVALLDGWQNSRGAKVERDLAVGLGMQCKWLELWLNSAAVAKQAEV